jgi:HEPN domain-containing protein
MSRTDGADRGGYLVRLRREVDGWIKLATGEMQATRTLMANRDDNQPFTAAGHCQQAAEKLVKGTLVACSVDFKKTHDMEQLWELLPQEATALRAIPAQDIATLTQYAVETRYPASSPNPMDIQAPVSWADVERAWATVLAVHEAALSEIAARFRPGTSQ